MRELRLLLSAQIPIATYITGFETDFMDVEAPAPETMKTLVTVAGALGERATFRVTVG
jgi:hypothetical protein